MRREERASWLWPVVALVLLGSCPDAHAQSPYGLAARQTIPFVIDLSDDRGVSSWSTEITIHNPRPSTIDVSVFYFGAVGSATPSMVPCPQQTVGPGRTVEFSVRVVCVLAPGLNYGRLDLSALRAQGGDPSLLVFLTSARVSGPGGRYFTVEGFPQGNLSGNKGFAAVTGLKSGFIDGAQWLSACYAAALNEPTPVFVRLVDGNGNPVGGFTGAALPTGGEVWPFPDAFAAVGAPPGNYRNVTALFSTAIQGGQGGAGVFAFCRIVNLTFGREAFAIAKYLDNSDDGRVHHTVTRAFIRSETNDPQGTVIESTVHGLYFQHPDRVMCSVRFVPNPDLPFSDLGQMRLIDPDGNISAGGPHAQSFTLDLGEKSTRHNGSNGQWLVEVGADHAIRQGGGLHKGGPLFTEYSLTCSSGNGHNLEQIVGGHFMNCTKGKGNDAFCDFTLTWPGP